MGYRYESFGEELEPFKAKSVGGTITRRPFLGILEAENLIATVQCGQGPASDLYWVLRGGTWYYYAWLPAMPTSPMAGRSDRRIPRSSPCQWL